jgi:1,4-dihydroxy-2-naphthoate octaprenyltransferase
VNKLRSRTFWLAIFWTILVAVGLVVAAVKEEAPWLTALITSSGVVVTAYVGGEKYIDSKKDFRKHE